MDQIFDQIGLSNIKKVRFVNMKRMDGRDYWYCIENFHLRRDKSAIIHWAQMKETLFSNPIKRNVCPNPINVINVTS